MCKPCNQIGAATSCQRAKPIRGQGALPKLQRTVTDLMWALGRCATRDRNSKLLLQHRTLLVQPCLVFPPVAKLTSRAFWHFWARTQQHNCATSPIREKMLMWDQRCMNANVCFPDWHHTCQQVHAARRCCSGTHAWISFRQSDH